jgi:hypothetical protein
VPFTVGLPVDFKLGHYRCTRTLDKAAANPVATALTSPRTTVEAIGVTFPV